MFYVCVYNKIEGFFVEEIYDICLTVDFSGDVKLGDSKKNIIA